MSLELPSELEAQGVHTWIVTDAFAIGTYRVPAGCTADEHEDVEEWFCFGLGDVQCEVTVEGEGSALAGPDTLRFHKPGDQLLSRKAPDVGWAQTWVALSEDLVQDIGLPPRSFLRAPLPQLAAVRAFFRRVERGECPLWIEETLTSLLEDILHAPRGTGPRRSPTPRQRELARQADDFLSQRYFRPLRLEDVARELGVTAPYLSRSYHATLGSRMHERLMSLRLSAALSRLSDGAADLTSLALDLGFASHSHFTAAFHRRVGMPPSAFRESCR